MGGRTCECEWREQASLSGGGSTRKQKTNDSAQSERAHSKWHGMHTSTRAPLQAGPKGTVCGFLSLHAAMQLSANKPCAPSLSSSSRRRRCLDCLVVGFCADMVWVKSAPEAMRDLYGLRGTFVGGEGAGTGARNYIRWRRRWRIQRADVRVPCPGADACAWGRTPVPVADACACGRCLCLRPMPVPACA